MPLRNFSLELDDDIYQAALARAHLEGRPLEAVLVELLRMYAGHPPERLLTTYIVKRGDSLARIARRLYGDPHKYPVIQHANNLSDPGRIWVGQVLIIPSLAAPDGAEEAPPAPEPPPSPGLEPPTTPGIDPCTPTGENYLTLPVDEADQMPAEEGKAARREWALKLETLFAHSGPLRFTGGVYRVVQQQSRRRPQAQAPVDFVVTQVSLAARSGSLVRVPKVANQTGGYKVLVTHAEEGQLVLRYVTGVDEINSIQAIKIEGICVDPNLLGLVKQIQAAHRHRLPALSPEQPFGRAQGRQVHLTLHDSRPALDPVSRRNWWAG